MSGNKPNGDRVNVAQVAALIGVARPNVYRWLERRGLQPVAIEPWPVGRVYDRQAVLQARQVWLAGRDREADERRRRTANARVRGKVREGVGG